MQLVTDLKNSGLAVKKTTLYKERNEEARQQFEQEVKNLNPADVIYMDECGLEESLCREYGRSIIGKRLMGEVSGKRTKRTSIIAGLINGKPVAPFHFQGYCNTAVMLAWATEILVPALKPGQTVIMDNASFHKSAKLRAVIETAGCQLLFLPPYSPDLNPIEKWWAKLKAWIRRIRNTGMTLRRCLRKVFIMSI